MKKLFLVILSILILSCASTQKVEKQRVVASTWMPASESDEDSQLAGAFGLALAYWLSKFGNANELPDGEFIPLFSSLEFAFNFQLNYWSQLPPDNRSSIDYMEAIKKVKDSGFLSEYIWVNHSHPSWGEPDSSLKIIEFVQWSLSNLVGHQPRIESKIELSWKQI